MRPVNELTLYKYRHLIGYSCLILLSVGLLLLFITKIPNGLSQAEESSALTSSHIVFDQHFLDTTQPIDLPYHLAQWGSLHFFGLSPLGVRLPSLVFAAASMVFMMLILRRWLQENVAIAWGIIVATSTWFLVLGRTGTPDIMVVFWTSLILLLATLVSQQSRGYQAWKALSVIAIGLSFYTPLMAYLFAASALATAFQPHLRYVVRYAEKTSVSLGTILFLAILVPLGWQIWRNPHVIAELLAIPPMLPGPFAFFKDLLLAISTLINPFKASIDTLITPLLGIPIVILATVGFIRTLRDSHSVRSYVLLLWLAVLTPVIGLNPTHLHVIFVPVMLLGAIGMQSLFRYWYDLFPRNPYARIFGLLPLALFMGSLVTFNYQTYFTGTAYAAAAAGAFNADPVMLTQTIGSKVYRDQRITLITTADRQQLYQIDTAVTKHLRVVTPTQFVDAADANNVIVDIASEPLLNPIQRQQLPTLQDVLVNDRKNDALRFRIYGQQ